MVLAGCSKKPFTQPTPVNITLAMQGHTAFNGKLTINQLSLRPISFIIEGKRLAADDITLIRDLNSAQWNLTTPEPIAVDIPQGEYDFLRISFNFPGDLATEEDIDDDIDEWWEEIQQGGDGEDELEEIVEKYANQGQPALSLRGQFEHTSRGIVDVWVVVPNAWVHEVLATQKGKVTLSAGNTYESYIDFNVADWWQPITLAAMENAYFAEGDNNDVLFIHPKINTSLYTLLFSQLENAQSWEIR